MKKTIVVLIVVMLLIGCSLTNTPTSKVEDYLNKYISLSDEVVMDIDNTLANENLSSANKELYKKALMRSYQNLKYKIKDESLNGDYAKVTVRIDVFDFYKSEEESLNYLNDNYNEFNDENNLFSNELYNRYRLNQLLNINEVIEYDIIFELDKKNGEWILRNPDRQTLEKINGFYNYKEN